jgi:hypothetical protein
MNQKKKQETTKNDIGFEGSHSGGYEEFYLLGYNTMYSVEIQPTFRSNM